MPGPAFRSLYKLRSIAISTKIINIIEQIFIANIYKNEFWTYIKLDKKESITEYKYLATILILTPPSPLYKHYQQKIP